MVRVEMRMKSKELSDDDLKALWVALDRDGSGLISAGEFGQFMNLASPAPVTLRERRALLAANARHEASTVRQQMRRKHFDAAAQRKREYELELARAMAELQAVRDGDGGAVAHAAHTLDAPRATRVPLDDKDVTNLTALPAIGSARRSAKAITVRAAYSARIPGQSTGLSGGLRSRVGGPLTARRAR